MHGYSLHTDHTLKCQCCAVAQSFHFTSRSDQVICGFCRPHCGGTAAKVAQQNRDHAALYLTRLTQTAKQRKVDQMNHRTELEHRDRLLAEKNRMIRELEIAVGDIPASIRNGQLNEAVLTWLIDERLSEAAKRSEVIFRSQCGPPGT